MVLGPLFWGWFKARAQQQVAWCYPTGPAEVSVAGRDPLRILVIGDGPAAGCGVLTHELGIAGYLARHIARQVGRGVTVTVAAQPAASARSIVKRLDSLCPDGYDSVVLMLTTTDAFCLTTRRSWRRDMAGLVRALGAEYGPSLFVTSTASMHLARSLAPFARRLTSSHAHMLNAVTRRVCARSNTRMIPLDAASELTSRTYAKWGRRIGGHIVSLLREAEERESCGDGGI